jgi:hypothetical protein
MRTVEDFKQAYKALKEFEGRNDYGNGKTVFIAKNGWKVYDTGQGLIIKDRFETVEFRLIKE